MTFLPAFMGSLFEFFSPQAVFFRFLFELAGMAGCITAPAFGNAISKPAPGLSPGNPHHDPMEDENAYKSIDHATENRMNRDVRQGREV
ncbi:MAG: hypothetical protein KY410_05920 [Proteobacteria bacterium]|nr:hypothetical protein [Pseudomonadota bacterium]